MREAEFDRFADEYHQQHARNIAVTGEAPEFFARYKIADLAALVRARHKPAARIVDFGAGIGNSLPFFRTYFPDAALTNADVSTRSMDLARSRFPGREAYVTIGDTRVPLDDASQDVVFSACVFHHIPHAEHAHWLGELHRICRPGGLLVIFEHNPFNPLTVRAVDTCPFDENAVLVRPGVFRRAVEAAGWTKAEIRYRIFFPRALAALRPLERLMQKVALGAQYCVVAERAAQP